MARKKMIRQLIMPFTVTITISLIILTWFLFSSLKTFYLEETQKSLLSKAYIFKSQVISLLDQDTANIESLQSLCIQAGDSSGTRITVMLSDGIVVADSEEEPGKMDNHDSRTEMEKALQGEVGYSTRYSNTLQRTMMYLALPLNQDGKLIGVLRLSVTTQSIDETLNTLLFKIAFAVLVVAILSALMAFYISKKISQPLEELRVGAERIAQGDFDKQLPVPESKEIAQLALAMNKMAAELDKKIKIITRQKNEQEAILQSMIEGVVAVDRSEKIIIMNSTAGELFSVDTNQAQGKSVYEIIRNPELQAIIIKTLKSNKHHDGELTLNLDNEKFISYNSSILIGSSGKSIGVLLVLNDLTRLRHLENIRQDLVANVSHELRTPITSIKGFVETLSEGAIDNKDDARRFLTIIDKQVNRLNAIIEDLLLLSSIEQNKDNNKLLLVTGNVLEIISSAVEICQNKATGKNIQIVVECDSKLVNRLNAPLMEQALVNLIDNAIKYSPDGKQVFIKSYVNNNKLEISVHDQGLGIDKKHFLRLFERFYVIDQARSRELGGTGLGLAIVKHIAAANNGLVRVESKLSKGSVFTIEIPVSL